MFIQQGLKISISFTKVSKSCRPEDIKLSIIPYVALKCKHSRYRVVSFRGGFFKILERPS